MHSRAIGRSARPRNANPRPGDYTLWDMLVQPARTRLQVDERRQQLLALGLELFARQTYDELSIDEIAKTAGVSKGLLYHYFPSKRAFYVASVQEASRQLLEETNTAPSPEAIDQPDPKAIRAGLRAFLAYVLERRVAYAFLLRGGVGTDPEVGEIIEGTRQALIDRMFSRLAKFGVRRDDPVTRLKLRGWIGLIESASLDWVESQQLDIDAFSDLLVEMTMLIVASLVPRP